MADLVPLLESLRPEVARGLASVQVNDPDGLLLASNANGSIKELAGPALVVPVAIAASVAVPVFAKIQERALASRDLQSLKEIAIGLRIHAGEHGGTYPENLTEILATLEVEPSFLEFVDRETGKSARVWYARGLNEDSVSRLVLLAHPFVLGSGRAVAFSDGSVDTIDEEEFQRLLREQTPDFEK